MQFQFSRYLALAMLLALTFDSIAARNYEICPPRYYIEKVNEPSKTCELNDSKIVESNGLIISYICCETLQGGTAWFSAQEVVGFGSICPAEATLEHSQDCYDTPCAYDEECCPDKTGRLTCAKIQN